MPFGTGRRFSGFRVLPRLSDYIKTQGKHLRDGRAACVNPRAPRSKIDTSNSAVYNTVAGSMDMREGSESPVATVSCRSGSHGFPVETHRMRYLHLPAAAPASPPLPAVVFVHGLMGYSFSWRHNLEFLCPAPRRLCGRFAGHGTLRPARSRVRRISGSRRPPRVCWICCAAWAILRLIWWPPRTAGPLPCWPPAGPLFSPASDPPPGADCARPSLYVRRLTSVWHFS